MLSTPLAAATETRVDSISNIQNYPGRDKRTRTSRDCVCNGVGTDNNVMVDKVSISDKENWSTK